VTVLAGDIGGTKTLLQISQPGDDGVQVLYEQRFVSGDYPEFDLMLRKFIDTAADHCAAPNVACFGVAGPVSGRTARTTNLPWTLDADQLESQFNIQKVRLINDFQSVGYGIEALHKEDIVTLQTGKEVAQGTRVIIGAGTGLGQGLLVWQHDHYEVVASEGGHASFSASDEQQIELLRYLRKRFGHATWERAVSGRGLVNLFEFMLDSGKTESDALHQARQDEDPAAAISRFALSGEDALAVETLDLFARLYGAQAGNLALTGLAVGGVYVAGGVAPRIIDKLKDGAFMSAFIDKEERMQDLLKAMPVHVVVNAHVGLLGSALAAARLAT
jgi:glucokinase